MSIHTTEVIINICLTETPRDKIVAKFRRIMDLPFNPAETRNDLALSLNVNNGAGVLLVEIIKVEWLEIRTKITIEKTGLLPRYIMKVKIGRAHV